MQKGIFATQICDLNIDDLLGMGMVLGGAKRFMKGATQPLYNYTPMDVDLSDNSLSYRAQSTTHGGSRKPVLERHVVKVFVTRLLSKQNHEWNELYPWEQGNIIDAIKLSFPKARFKDSEVLSFIKGIVRLQKQGGKFVNFVEVSGGDANKGEVKERQVSIVQENKQAGKRRRTGAKEASFSTHEPIQRLRRTLSARFRDFIMDTERLEMDEEAEDYGEEE